MTTTDDDEKDNENAATGHGRCRSLPGLLAWLLGCLAAVFAWLLTAAGGCAALAANDSFFGVVVVSFLSWLRTQFFEKSRD